MAGIARKSRAQRFPVFALSFHGCVGRFRALASFHRLSIEAREAERSSPVRFLGDPRAGRTGDPSFSRGPRSNRARKRLAAMRLRFSRLASSSRRRFDERRGHFERDSANGKQKGKTGRFGPIGPETAQYQLPHNIVTFGMVRARDVRVCRERERRGERRSRFAISSRLVERLNFIRDRFSASRQTCRSSATSKGF